MSWHLDAVDIFAIGKIFHLERRRIVPLGVSPHFATPLALDRARDDSACRNAMLRSDMSGNQPNRGRQHRGVIGESYDRKHVRNEIERQYEIRQRADQGDPNPAGRGAIEGAEIGGDQILGKRKSCGESPKFRPEFASNPRLIARCRIFVCPINTVRPEGSPEHSDFLRRRFP
jgi:hypothetical protein